MDVISTGVYREIIMSFDSWLSHRHFEICQNLNGILFRCLANDNNNNSKDGKKVT